jgi:hypothetical protein
MDYWTRTEIRVQSAAVQTAAAAAPRPSCAWGVHHPRRCHGGCRSFFKGLIVIWGWVFVLVDSCGELRREWK